MCTHTKRDGEIDRVWRNENRLHNTHDYKIFFDQKIWSIMLSAAWLKRFAHDIHNHREISIVCLFNGFNRSEYIQIQTIFGAENLRRLKIDLCTIVGKIKRIQRIDPAGNFFWCLRDIVIRNANRKQDEKKKKAWYENGKRNYVTWFGTWNTQRAQRTFRIWQTEIRINYIHVNVCLPAQFVSLLLTLNRKSLIGLCAYGMPRNE